MTWKGRRVLVTGATGFIGSALARRLVKDGADVHLLVRAASSPARLGTAWGRTTRHAADLRDPAGLERALKAAAPEIVFHLAKDRDGTDFARESGDTRRFAAALRAAAPGLKRLVRTAHAGGARGGDAALNAELAASGLPVVALELFLVYGPGMEPGDFPANILAGERPRTAGAAIKDFVHVDDVVEAYRLAALAAGVEGRTIPVGTGRGRTEAEAAALLLRALGSKDAPPRREGSREGHPADARPALELLGWRARVQLEQGLARLAGAPAARPDAGLERRAMTPWLGEAAARSGAPRGGERGPWALVASAAESFARGDAEAAERAADEFILALPGAAAGPAMKALLAAARGDKAETERWLESCGPRGPQGWALALRGMMRARWEELDGARADLEASARAEASAWAAAARADVYNRVGLYWRALSELGRLRRLMPRSPEPDSRAAAIHLEQAQYEEALERMDRAVKLAPKDPALRRQRSRVNFVQGDLRAARADIDAACALAPADPDLREERLRLCLLLDDHAAADALLAGSWPPGAREFWLGYRRCRERRYAESAELFAAAEAAGGARAATSAFYRFVARVLETSPEPSLPEGKELVVMGLGYRHPYQLSVEAIRVLRGCEEFFSNLSDATVADFLGLFGVPMRTIVFRRTDGQSTACARIAMRAMKGLRRGGVTTRGMPNYYGRLAYRLVQDCAERGIACRIVPTVSIADFLPSLVGLAEGDLLGLQVRDTRDMDGLDPRLPLVLYNFASGPYRLEQIRRLSAAWPAERPCWLLAGSGQREYEPQRTTVGALESALMTADAAVTLYLPAARPA